MAARTGYNITRSFESHSVRNLRIWILGLGLLPLSHSTILFEPRPQNIHVLALQYVSAFYPLLLIALTYMLVLNYMAMGTTSDQLSGYGNHFTDVVSMLDGGWIQKHPILMSLPHFLFTKLLFKEHFPFAIASSFIVSVTFLPPLLLIFYPCKVFNSCLNCCHKRWHTLHTFVEVFQGCYVQRWSHWRKGFEINIWSLFAVSISTPHCKCQY